MMARQVHFIVNLSMAFVIPLVLTAQEIEFAVEAALPVAVDGVEVAEEEVAAAADVAPAQVVVGEFLAAPAVAAPTIDTPVAPESERSKELNERLLISRGAEWKYRDAKDPPDDKWIDADFNDNDWSSGSAPLGYGDTGINTPISFGDDDQNKHPVAYFRLKFHVATEFAGKPAIGQIMNDDAAVVYLNGKEVYRRNLPEGDVKNLFATVSSKPERRYWTFVIDPQLLQDGDNTLAVSVHQRGGVSSDLLHDVELVACDEVTIELATAVSQSESLVFSGFDTGQKPIIGGGSKWKYWADDSTPQDWYQLAFDDSQWQIGSAPLGYGEDDIKTDIAEGKDTFPPFGCFRKEFRLSADQAAKPLVGQIQFDDAAAVYVNGKEVTRFLLPEGDLGTNTMASEKINDENYLWTFVLQPEILNEGKNLIAFSVHQFPDSGDMIAKLILRPADDEVVNLATKFQAQEAGANVSSNPLDVPDPIIVAKESVWKYWDGDDDMPPEGWTSLDFDDSKWQQGKGPLGYGDSTVVTNVSFGKDDQDKNPAVYFRHTFEANDLVAMQAAVGHVMHDDAVIVYLNGKEVFRRNLVEDFDEAADFRAMAEAKVGQDDHAMSYGVLQAISGSFETHYWTFAIDQGIIRPGKNVLALRVHQCNPTSSDLAMDLELTTVSRTQLIADANIQDRESVGDVQFVDEITAQLVNSGTSFTHLSDGQLTYSLNDGQLYTVDQDAALQAKSYAPGATFARAMEGDTIEKLAMLQGIDLEKLIILNRAKKNKVYTHREIYLKVWDHEVQAGESLDTIAKYYKTSSEELAKLNDLAPNAVLTRGQRIQVPGEFQYHGDEYNSYLMLAMYSNRSSSRVPYDRTSVKNTIHTLKDGEDLKAIAKKYKVAEDFLRKMNGLEKDQEPAQRVLIEYSVKPLPDTTLQEIAAAFNMNIDDVMDVNGFKSPEDMKPGVKVQIPYGKQMGFNQQQVTSPKDFVVYEVSLGDREFKKANRENPFAADEESTTNVDDEQNDEPIDEQTDE